MERLESGRTAAAPGQNGFPAEAARLARRYREVRSFSEHLCEPLAVEDYVVQPMPDASPAKWHLAHTTWFFETFVLEPSGVRASPGPQYAYLFNSYYNTLGPQHCRPRRGLLSRPTVAEVYHYRREVDGTLLRLIETADAAWLERWGPVLELGLHHEQQHQELLLTDIKQVLSLNMPPPSYRPHRDIGAAAADSMGWRELAGGLHWIGHAGAGFAYDNEGPRHRVFVEPFRIAARLVQAGEYLRFMEAGGYRRPELWLSAGWAAAREQGWTAPLYWTEEGGRWRQFTLAGMRDVEAPEPVCHVSFYEADAYARWAGARLPTEAEWEVAAGELPLEGRFVEAGRYHPGPPDPGQQPAQMFGEAWQWTGSQYRPYPGYRPPAGALGEYNGKFMSNQFVLRGGSCATSRTHIRRTYRNFFPPEARWQFTGIRLAADA